MRDTLYIHAGRCMYIDALPWFLSIKSDVSWVLDLYIKINRS